MRFGNFSTTETTIGTRAALMLEFDRPQDEGIWSCREYFVAGGTLQYVLGFGTNRKQSMFELYDRMVRSFEFRAEYNVGMPTGSPNKLPQRAVFPLGGRTV